MIVSRSSTLPVTIDQVRTHCRIDHQFDTAEQSLVETYIKAATKYAESFTHSDIVETVYEFCLKGFPAYIEIERKPLKEIVSIEYLQDGEMVVLPAESYYLCRDYKFNFIVPICGTKFPETTLVKIRYSTGYQEIPEELQLAIIYCAAHWYEHREPVVVGAGASKVPLTIDALLNLHSISSYG